MNFHIFTQQVLNSKYYCLLVTIVAIKITQLQPSKQKWTLCVLETLIYINKAAATFRKREFSSLIFIKQPFKVLFIQA